MTHLPAILARQPSTECWPWPGYRDREGYGRSGSRLAHRIVFERLRGAIPDGLSLDHLCRNRACVNPAHLEPVTTGVNVMRGESFGATNAVKTRCAHGHEYDVNNTYIRPNGHRDCRACIRARVRRYQARRAA